MDEQFKSNLKTFVAGLKRVVTDDEVEVVRCHLTSIEIWENYRCRTMMMAIFLLIGS